jgi:hypothetical protein
VSEDVDEGENGAKVQIVWEYSLACLKTKLQIRLL